MNIPNSSEYNTFNALQIGMQQTLQQYPDHQSQNTPLLRCLDSFNNLMYVQIMPPLPSFYSFHNCQKGFATLNNILDDKLDEDVEMKSDKQNAEGKSGRSEISESQKLKFLSGEQNLELNKQNFEDESELVKTSSEKKKIYKQNPTRNILTNIGNQLITYLSSKRKSLHIIEKIRSQWNNQKVEQYYKYAQKKKKQLGYYLNLKKIGEFWYPKQICWNSEYQKLMRCISRYFLTQVITQSILISKKMKKQSKILHLRAKKQLLKRLKSCQ